LLLSLFIFNYSIKTGDLEGFLALQFSASSLANASSKYSFNNLSPCLFSSNNINDCIIEALKLLNALLLFFSSKAGRIKKPTIY